MFIEDTVNLLLVDGVYKNKEGNTVQGYILNDKGEIMQGTKAG